MTISASIPPTPREWITIPTPLVHRQINGAHRGTLAVVKLKDRQPEATEQCKCEAGNHTSTHTEHSQPNELNHYNNVL